MSSSFVSYVVLATLSAIVLLYGCLGELITEKSGHLNLGTPGIMCMGAYGGCLFVSKYMNSLSNSNNAWYILIVVLALIGSMLFAALGGLIYAFLTVSLRCNQNIVGLALTTFGAGFASYFMGNVNSEKGKANLTKASIKLKKCLPFADRVGWFGKIFLSHGILVYLAIGLAIGLFFILKKTRIGLNLRAVGESPATADAMSINVTRYKYLAILIGSAISGIGGMFYVMNKSNGIWDNSANVEAFGWLALALVIFSTWNPLISIAGAFLFGLLDRFGSFANNFGIHLNAWSEMFTDILPYVVTIIVLIVTSIIGKKETQPPSSLGLNYFREDR